MFTKKGQMQINETILVIFIFTVMMLIGFVLFNRWMSVSIEQEFLDNERSRFSNMLTTVAEMPEIKCSSQGKDFNCVDSLKLLSANKGDYVERFGFREIKVNLVYPEVRERECSTATYPSCDEFLVYSNRPSEFKEEEIIRTPVSLYYPITEEYKIGVLEIRWFLN